MKFRVLTQPLPVWRKMFAAMLFVGGSALVSAESELPAVDGSVASVMQQFAGDVRLLMPLMYRSEESLNPSEMASIQQTIGNMQQHLGRVETVLAPRSNTYQTSIEILAQQLGQANKQLAEGRVEYGLDLLRSATSVCASCHTQDDRTAKWLAPSGEIMRDPFVAGEYFFMTRQYDRAYDAYESWLGAQASLVYDKRTLTAFQRLLLTALQVRKSPEDISLVLNKYIQRENINYMLSTHLVAWREGVEELQSVTDIASHPDSAVLAQLAEDWLTTSKNPQLAHVYLPENSRPKLVWLRGELYHALTMEGDSAMVGDWLYWLAVSDRLLEYRFFYSLADMYLKQCMLDYSDDPIARRCYDEYGNYIEFFYSGSGGTFIPDDVKSELKMLKSKVYKSEQAVPAKEG